MNNNNAFCENINKQTLENENYEKLPTQENTCNLSI